MSDLEAFDRIMAECITVYRATGKDSFIVWYELASEATHQTIMGGFVAFFRLINDLFSDFQETIVIDADNMSLSVANVIEFIVGKAHESDPDMPTDMTPFSLWFNNQIDKHNLTIEAATTKTK